MIDLIGQLNKQQFEAVTHEGGPLLIIAGAGSGKTRVITYRIAWLIDSGKCQPYNILGLTFTNKAAAEMKERVLELLRGKGQNVHLGTFHATCARFLRREIENVGLSRDFLIYDANDQLSVIKAVMDTQGLDKERFNAKMFQKIIQKAKTQLQDPDIFSQYCGKQYLTTADVYQEYQERLFKNNALDFGDLIMLSVRILQDYPEVLARTRERFLHLLVDEYQDTNLAQFQLIKLLVGDSGNICVVGDDDQSIYGFRGANIRNILEFENHFNNTTVIYLETNYRSTKNILHAANAVAKVNHFRKPKNLRTENALGEKIKVLVASDDNSEVEMIVKRIRELRTMMELSYNDMAVFYRTNAQSRILEERFTESSIPYVVIGGLGFYQRKEIKDIISYLRVIAGIGDDLSVQRIINMPLRGIGKTTVEKLEDFAREHETTFWRACCNVRDCETISRGTQTKIENFVSLINDLQEESRKLEVPTIIESVISEIDYKRELEKDKHTFQMRVENLMELARSARLYVEEMKDDATLIGFLEKAALATSEDRVEETEGHVSMMTLHAAKGLEFPCVFIVGCIAGLLPHHICQKPEEIEEERRLFYVGMTRAKQFLHLTYPQRRQRTRNSQSTGGDTIIPSQFLEEIPKKFVERVFSTTKPVSSPYSYRSKQWGSTQPRRFSDHKPDKPDGYKRGEKVFHSKFGEGEVVESETGNTVTVYFPRVGVKRLATKYANLKRI